MRTTLHCGHCGRTEIAKAYTEEFAQHQALRAGWRWADSRASELLCPNCTAVPGPLLNVIEWVGGHLEAHGQLLVRTTSPAEGLAQAAAVAGRFAPAFGRYPHLICFGLWRTVRCQHCDHVGGAGHPTWHYLPAREDEPGAFVAAEVRLTHVLASVVRTSPHSERRTAA